MSDNNAQKPDNNADRDQQLEAVIADYIRACETGSVPNRGEILKRHPELADELRQFFGQHDRLNQIAAPIRGFGDELGQAVGPGQQLSYVGNYELLEEIARGGMGVVYKARQTTLGRIVAVKMIVSGRLASEQDVQRFQVEAQAAAGLQHPNIVSIHEVGQHEGWHYFSMDFFEGRDLSKILRENLLSAKQAATYVRQMAEAIHYAHQQGILHRDLKPSNILIDSHDQVRITDFGLAMRVEGGNDLTRTGQIVGTPSYMPPEQGQGKRSLIGPGSDVYSLGAVLYECLTGRAPFRADSVLKTIEQVIHAEAASPRTLNAAIPRDLETICLKCLEKEPHRRYGTSQLLADDIGRFLEGKPIVARPSHALERGAKWVRRHPTAAALSIASIVAMLSLVGVGIGLYYNSRLEAANTRLQTSNKQLGVAKDAIESSHQQLSDASLQLKQSFEEVKAERAMARRHLYASRMALIQVAEKNNQPDRIVQLLRSVIPENAEQEDLRDFEWNFLWRKYHGEHSQFQAHAGAITSIAFSPDEKWFATASKDHTIKIWDTLTLKEIRTLRGHTESVNDIAVSGDSNIIVSVSSDNSLRIWNLESEAETRVLEGHVDPIQSVALSSDRKYIASGNKRGTVIVWDLDSGQKANQFLHTEIVTGLSFQSENTNLVIAGPTSVQARAPLTDSITKIDLTDKISSKVAFHPSENKIAFGVADRSDKSASIKARELNGDTSVWTVDFPSLVTEFKYSSDGNLLVASGYDQTIKILDSAAGTEIGTFYAGESVRSLAFYPSGSRFVAGAENGSILIWTVPGREVLQLSKGHKGSFKAFDVSFAQNGQLLVCGRVWNVSSGSIHPAKLLCNGQKRIAIPSNSNWVAGAVETALVDLITGQTIVALQGERMPGRFNISLLSASNDGMLVAGSFCGRGVELWDATTGAHLKTFPITSPAVGVALSPDGNLIAGGSAAFSLSPSIADSQSPKPKGPVALLSDNDALQVWETKTGTRVFHDGPFAGGIWNLAFSPDGRLLAAALGTFADKGLYVGRIRLWDTTTWRMIQDLRGHSGCVWSLSFNASSTRLASGTVALIGIDEPLNLT